MGRLEGGKEEGRIWGRRGRDTGEEGGVLRFIGWGDWKGRRMIIIVCTGEDGE